MAAVSLDALDYLAHSFRGFAIDVVHNELGITENGVQRGPQFVAHIGEKLGLVPAFDLELTAFLADFTEELCILDGQH